jgi:hypothetical protein
VTSPGVIEFDKERLTARAGRIVFEFTNDLRKGHNIRIHTGGECCFGPGSKDIGGTRTIGTGRTRAVLDLAPGRLHLPVLGRRALAHAARQTGGPVTQDGRITELISKLVAIDSVNPTLVPGGAGEGEAAAFVVDWAHAEGLEADVLEGTPGGRAYWCGRAARAAGARCSYAGIWTPWGSTG